MFFKKIVTLLFAACAAVSAGFAKTGIPSDADFWSDYPDDELATALTERMTDEELFAQILMFGWAGAEPSDLLNSWVIDRGLGSVKVFGWNTGKRDSIPSLRKVFRTFAFQRWHLPVNSFA